MKFLNDLLAFAVEIAMLIGLGRVGFEYAESAGYPSWSGLLLPVFVILIWWLWAAPKPNSRLKIPWLTILKMFLFGATAILLWSSGYTSFAIVLFIASVVQQVLEVYLYNASK